MNFLRNNKLQKISATFLLAMMMFITAVKTFHTHDLSAYEKAEKSNTNPISLKAIFSCAICDFQFAKDSDVQVVAIDIVAPVYHVTNIYGYTVPSLFSFSVISSVRGPPSLIS